MDRAAATHTKGVAFLLYSRLNACTRWMRLPSLLEYPRLIPCSLISPNQRSTWLSEDE